MTEPYQPPLDTVLTDGLSNRDILVMLLEGQVRLEAKLETKVGRGELFGWLTLMGGLLLGILNA